MDSDCGTDQLFPGVWFSFFGTEGDMTISACGNNNALFAFSLYTGASCDVLSCVLDQSTYSVTKALDSEKCTFPNGNVALALRDLSALSFTSVKDQRYFVYVAHDKTQPEDGALTGDFRFYVSSAVDPPTFPPFPFPTRSPTIAPSMRPSVLGLQMPTQIPTTFGPPSGGSGSSPSGPSDPSGGLPPVSSSGSRSDTIVLGQVIIAQIVVLRSWWM
jgi:hypothetical protein